MRKTPPSDESARARYWRYSDGEVGLSGQSEDRARDARDERRDRQVEQAVRERDRRQHDDVDHAGQDDRPLLAESFRHPSGRQVREQLADTEQSGDEGRRAG